MIFHHAETQLKRENRDVFYLSIYLSRVGPAKQRDEVVLAKCQFFHDTKTQLKHREQRIRCMYIYISISIHMYIYLSIYLSIYRGE